MSQLSSAVKQSKKKSGNDFTIELKKDMQKVRDTSKKSEKYAAVLERDNFTVENIEEHKKF